VVEIRYRPSPQDAELFAQALLTLPVESWWEDWMRHADRLLDDPELVNIVHQVLLKRRPQSRTRGRLSTPAEVVLRLMVLKHVRNWSYGVLAREVRANLVYRQFTRMGHHRMPHAKTIGKLGLLLGPTVVQQIAPARRRSGPGREGDPRQQTAGGHHGGGDQYPLPHR
jgi:IS5 family transposase